MFDSMMKIIIPCNFARNKCTSLRNKLLKCNDKTECEEKKEEFLECMEKFKCCFSHDENFKFPQTAATFVTRKEFNNIQKEIIQMKKKIQKNTE